MSNLITGDMSKPREPGIYFIFDNEDGPGTICPDVEWHMGEIGDTPKKRFRTWPEVLVKYDGRRIESLAEHDNRIREETVRRLHGRYVITRGPLAEEELEESRKRLDSSMMCFNRAPRLYDSATDDDGKGSK